jgi:GTP cyclohydrolase II
MPKPVPVRVQSSCLFGESFGAVDCDCADQLRASLGVVASEGGILVYLYEEGRGVGLKKKIEAIGVQQRLGCDTASAFRFLGLKPDPRDHRVATSVLLAILDPHYPIELITNNPEKVNAFRAAGLVVERRRGLVIKRSSRVAEYLEEKERVLGHELHPGSED